MTVFFSFLYCVVTTRLRSVRARRSLKRSKSVMWKRLYLATARSFQMVSSNFSLMVDFSKARRTVRVLAVYGKRTRNFVRCRWFTGYCCRGTPLVGPSISTRF
uniref:Putative secreted protein n=1 Tax=Anopheles triannulatus TaxID=58253 RepID=A0A2M4B0E5_9DIPT